MIQATFVEIPSIESIASPAVANPAGQSATEPENKGFSDTLQRQQRALSDEQRSTRAADQAATDEPELGPQEPPSDTPVEQNDQAAIGNVSPVNAAVVAANLPVMGSVLAAVPEPATSVAPVSGAELIERRLALANQSTPVKGSVKGVSAVTVMADGFDSAELGPRPSKGEGSAPITHGVKFVDLATPGSALASPVQAEATQVKPTLVAGGDPGSLLSVPSNSSLSGQTLPTGNGQMVDLIAAGARGEGASAGSVVGRSGLAPIDIPVTDPRWGAAVAQRVVVATKQGLQQAQITVTPANLGPIELQIQIQDDKASVTMVSPHASVRELLEGATPRLRELFEQQGMTLQDSHVADQDSQDGQFAEKGSNGNPENLMENGDLAGDEISLRVRQSVGLVDRYA